MSEQNSLLAVKLTISNPDPQDPGEPFVQPEDIVFQPLQSDKLCLGRSPSNDVVLNHAAVSGLHAAIVRHGNEFFLEDTNSRNGVLYKDARLQPQEKKLLRSGDLFRIVPFHIRFTCGVEVYDQLPPTENTAMIREEMLRSVLGGVMGHEDTPPKLIVMHGAQANMQQFELTGMHSEFRIGRAPQCDLVIQDENISREHAIVRRDPTGVVVRDNNSRNGVTVNGERLARGMEAPLKDRDEIMLGTVKLVYSDPEGAALAEKVGEVVSDPAAEQSAAAGGGFSIPQPSSPPPSMGDPAKAPEGAEGVELAEGEWGAEAADGAAGPDESSVEGGLEAPVPGEVAEPFGEAEGEAASENPAEASSGEGEAEAPAPVEPVDGLTTTQIMVIAAVVIFVVLGAVMLFALT